MKMHKNIISAGILFAAAALAAVTAALSWIASEKTAELEFTETVHTCNHSDYIDTYGAVDSAKQSVVRVLSVNGDSLSTAFGVGNCSDEAEYFLTAYHSVKGGEVYIYTKYMANASIKDGKVVYDYNLDADESEDNRYKAEVAAYDESLDIALIKTEKKVKNIFPLKILDSKSEIIQGERVYSLSFPVSEDKLLLGDGLEKARYADKDSITVLSGKTADIFENEDEFLHLEMNLSGGCSGSTVVLKNGTAAGMVKQGNFSIIIDPVREMEIYEPAGSGTAVKALDITAFLQKNSVCFETGELFEQAGCSCEFTEKADTAGEKNRDCIYRMLKTAETVSTLLFGVLNIIACSIILKNDPEE